VSKAPTGERPQEKPEEDFATQLVAVGRDRAACDRFYARLEAEGQTDRFVAAFTSSESRVLAATNQNLAVEEAFRRRMQTLREELGWAGGTGLERLLIERIALCWYHLARAEQRHASALQQGLEPVWQAFYDKAVARGERRYLSGLHALQVCRRLQIPAVQINLAEKQVNILQGQGLPLLQEISEERLESEAEAKG